MAQETNYFGSDKLVINSAMNAEMQKNLEDLSARLEEVVAEEAAARKDGDLSENERFRAAVEERDKLTARIAELKDQLGRVVVDDSAVSSTTVQMRTTLVIEDVNEGALKHPQAITIVPDGLGRFPDKISVGSPLGTALMGLNVGDTATYTDVRGRSQVIRILEIKA